MQKHQELTELRVDKHVRNIYRHVFTNLTPLKAEYFKSKEPVSWRNAKKSQYRIIKPGTNWGSGFDCAWFRFNGKAPISMKGKPVVALINLGGEACVFDEKGNPVQGLTEKSNEEIDPVGTKRQVKLFKQCRGGERVSLMVEAGANGLWGSRAKAVFTQADLAIFSPEAWGLFNDYDFLNRLMRKLPDTSRHRKLISRALNEVVNNFGEGDEKALGLCREILKPEMSRHAHHSALELSAVGHAHIDVAWLWPLRETVRKCGRTFSTALAMMQEYPEYCFGASQPYLYQMVKDNYPELYQRIKKAVKAGRWEVQGGMWVEADCNVTGGESLVRQVLIGKRFFRQEFGIDVKDLWLPDVFGFNAAMPQILKKCGIDYFMTSKISWNQFNRFPHDTLIWKGIDGTGIFTHFLAGNGYNCCCTPSEFMDFELKNKDADRVDHALCLFGIGDGGGGPGRTHIERALRATSMEDLPRVNMEFARDFFKKAKESARDLHTWEGELYLELHRGTYTTQALMKKMNRKIELSLREAEALWSGLHPSKYPAEELDRLWKATLLNQFHDIIPGSSINRVYKEAHEHYREIIQALTTLLDKGEKAYAANVDTKGKKNPFVVRNSLSWDREDMVILAGDLTAGSLVDTDGSLVPAQVVKDGKRSQTLVKVRVPSMGHIVVSQTAQQARQTDSSLQVRANLLENEHMRIEFAADGFIRRIYDKTVRREVLEKGKKANLFCLYDDMPARFDAWDIDVFYMEIPPTHPKLKSARVRETGPLRATIELKFKDKRFHITQRVSLMEGSKRIDFHTFVDWKEADKMLRVEFPINIWNSEATYEIQYGNFKRPTHMNTSWDMARFEVAAHKWADLSQPNYGVAILNDCKYGHKIHGNVISLNLLRSPKYPDPEADMHEHEFTYALFPHKGDFIAGSVIQEGYKLNIPLRAIKTSSHSGRPAPEASKLPAKFARLRLDTDNVLIEVLKKSEHGNDLVLRLYEATGCDVRTVLTFASPVKSVSEVDMMEENPKKVPVRSRRVSLSFKPFEIKTLMIKTINIS